MQPHLTVDEVVTLRPLFARVATTAYLSTALALTPPFAALYALSWSSGGTLTVVSANAAVLAIVFAAISLLRAQASSLGIDPHKVGVLGFSAGGRMVADMSNQTRRAYRPVDEADKQEIRPDFAIALYPGHLWKKPGLTLDPGVKIDPHAPPTLIVQAQDDRTDDIRESLTYYLALQQAKIPVEMHLYASGGHAFGLRKTENPVTAWPSLAETWMHTIGVLGPR